MTFGRTARSVVLVATLLATTAIVHAQSSGGAGGSGGGGAGTAGSTAGTAGIAPSASTSGQPSGAVGSPSVPGVVNNPTPSGVAPRSAPGVVNNPTPSGVAPSSSAGQANGSSISQNSTSRPGCTGAVTSGPTVGNTGTPRIMANEPGRAEVGSTDTTGTSADTTGTSSMRGTSTPAGAGC